MLGVLYHTELSQGVRLFVAFCLLFTAISREAGGKPSTGSMCDIDRGSSRPNVAQLSINIAKL